MQLFYSLWSGGIRQTAVPEELPIRFDSLFLARDAPASRQLRKAIVLKMIRVAVAGWAAEGVEKEGRHG